MASRAIAVQIERPNDYFYDPVYTVSGFGNAGAVAAGTGRALGLGAVSGGNRFRYFRTPAVPTLRTVPPEVLLSVEPAQQVQRQEVEAEPLAKTVATQSDYRESETQTVPFTPDGVEPEGGEQPELIHLRDLVWGRGLPAGVAEVEMIERARKRRAFEASLPDIGEDAETWKAMMEKQQMEEMARREAEIKSLQEQRLEIVKEALKTRDKEAKFVNEQRMEELRDRAAAMVEANSAMVHHQRIRELRKIAKSRQQVEVNRGAPRDIIDEYSNYASKIYAPIKHEGLRIDQDSDMFETTCLSDLSYQDIVDLENSIPRAMTNVRIERPKMAKFKSASEARKARELQGHLDKMTSTIRKKHQPEGADEDDDLAEYRKAPVVVRPPTPELRAPVAENDQKRLGVIFLQRLIRGRAIQNDMFQAKEKRYGTLRPNPLAHLYRHTRSCVKAWARHRQSKSQRYLRCAPFALRLALLPVILCVHRQDQAPKDHDAPETSSPGSFQNPQPQVLDPKHEPSPGTNSSRSSGRWRRSSTTRKFGRGRRFSGISRPSSTATCRVRWAARLGRRSST